MMYWIVLSILAVIGLNFFMLYWKSVKERNYIRCFLVQILLDEKTYEFQKEGLKNLIVDMEAKDALELSHRVNSSIDRLINQFGSKTLLASHPLIWEIKKESLKQNRKCILGRGLVRLQAMAEGFSLCKTQWQRDGP